MVVRTFDGVGYDFLIVATIKAAYTSVYPQRLYVMDAVKRSVTPSWDAAQTPLAAEAFREMLQHLEQNNAPMINALAWIALENEDAAPEIAAALLERLTNTAARAFADRPAFSGSQDDFILATLYLIDSIVKRVGPFLEAARRYSASLQSHGLAAVLHRLRKQQPSLQPRIDRLVKLWHEGRYLGPSFLNQVLKKDDAAGEHVEPSGSYPTSEARTWTREETPMAAPSTAVTTSAAYLPSPQVSEPFSASVSYRYQTDIQNVTERLLQFVQHGVLPPTEDVAAFERLIQAQVGALGPQDWSMRQYLEQLRMHMQMTIRSLAESRRASSMLAPGPGTGLGVSAYPETGLGPTAPFGTNLLPPMPPAAVAMAAPPTWNSYEASSSIPFLPNWSQPAAGGLSHPERGVHTASTHSHTSAVAGAVSSDDSPSASSESGHRRQRRRERCLVFRDIKNVSPAYAVAQLYNKYPLKADGTGIRFRTRTQLRNHLDWVFAENQRARFRGRGGMSRNWYLPVDEWLQRAGGWPGTGFETPPQGTAGAEDLLKDPFVEAGLVFAQSTGAVAPESATTGEHLQASDTALVKSEGKRPLQGASTVPGNFPPAIPAVTEDASCPICREELETFYDPDRDQWVWRDAIMDSETGLAFHRQCYGEGVNFLDKEQVVGMESVEHQDYKDTQAPGKRLRPTPHPSPTSVQRGETDLAIRDGDEPTTVIREDVQTPRRAVPDSAPKKTGETRQHTVSAENDSKRHRSRTNEVFLPGSRHDLPDNVSAADAVAGNLSEGAASEGPAAVEGKQAQAPSTSQEGDWNLLTVRALRERLDAAGIEHRHLKRKAELITALQAHGRNTSRHTK